MKIEQYIKNKQYREALGLPDQVTEQYTLLAQGEYNRNYYFRHPLTGKELVFRINYGSQMHLENQIQYEYNALNLLKTSGRTPRPFYVDNRKTICKQGVMVMEYLPGHALDYNTELLDAASVLADIHSVQIPENHGLISPQEPLKAIMEECENMVKTYMDSELGDRRKKIIIREMLDMGWKKIQDIRKKMNYTCCINTELNSTNFLMNGKKGQNYLIDWEKPVYGEPAQDLGHFLAPTTTFWKTDVILSEKQMEDFIDKYIIAVNGRFDICGLKERTFTYIPITCLRGITWCAMAWVDYQNPNKEIFNSSTFKKLEDYLSEDFLNQIYTVIKL